MKNDGKPRLLLVDDEERVLMGLNRLLYGRYDVQLAASGADALQQLELAEFDVVVSDMCMPGMDGSEFLKRVSARQPGAIRVLLTGQSDLEAAARAVNEGRIFRFLLKPASREVLGAAIEAALEQKRLLTVEKELLERTLTGSVDALSEVMALSNPAAFGRSRRLRRIVSTLAKEAKLANRWQLEMAASLSQLGVISLPAEVAQRALASEPLNEVEKAMVARSSQVPRQLLRHIPRLEPVIALVEGLETTPERGASLEQVFLHLSAAVERRLTAGEALDDVITSLEGTAEPVALDALRRARNLLLGSGAPKPLSIQGLQPGMVLAEDVRTRNGALLISRGHTVSEGLMVRLRNFAATLGVKEPLLVVLSGEEDAEPLRPTG
ncbi:MAG: response regulator [Myxococcota bacterium]